MEVTARLGVPQELLTDNGSNFVSKVMQRFCTVTGIKQIRTSPYHPQTNGMVERFNGTIKNLLRKLVSNPEVEWDNCIPYALWACRGTIHKSTGFYPYQLLFGKTMRMPLDQLVRFWKGKEGEDASSASEYVQTLRANIELVRDLAYEKERIEKVIQKGYYDQKARERSFKVGSFVLVFRLTLKNKLLNQWQGSYPIIEVVTPVTNRVDVGEKNSKPRTYHVNYMKKWNSPSAAVFLAESEEWEGLEEEGKGNRDTSLHESQLHELEKFKTYYRDVLRDVPGKTSLVYHSIPTGDACPVRLPPYRLTHKAQETLREEIKILLGQGIIKPSTSPWAAPIVLMPKKDGTRRMCVDYRKSNSIVTNDPYPLSNIEQLIANLGNSSYITTLDPTKGYHQVPVKKEQIEKTAFITPYGKYEYLTMPFGLVTAPSTFQRLMDRILQGLHGFAVTYLDDILIHSSTWEEHLEHLTIIFNKLREAGLTFR